MIEREDGERAGFDQDPHLLLRFLPQFDLLFHLGQVQRHEAPVALQFGDEQSRQRETAECRGDAQHRTRVPRQRMELLEQQAAGDREGGDLRAGYESADQQDGNDIQESQRKFGAVLPVHQGNRGDERPGGGLDPGAVGAGEGEESMHGLGSPRHPVSLPMNISLGGENAVCRMR